MMSSEDWVHLGFAATIAPLVFSAIHGFITKGKRQQKVETMWAWFEKHVIGGRS